MLLYTMLFAVVFVVLLISVLVNVVLSLKDRYFHRIEHHLKNPDHLDDILFR